MPYDIRALLPLVREGNRCLSCLAEELGVPRFTIITDLASMAGVFAIGFVSGICASCHKPTAIPRPK